MALLRQWLKLLNKIFVTGLLTAATVPHESEKRYIYFLNPEYQINPEMLNVAIKLYILS